METEGSNSLEPWKLSTKQCPTVRNWQLGAAKEIWTHGTNNAKNKVNVSHASGMNRKIKLKIKNQKRISPNDSPCFALLCSPLFLIFIFSHKYIWQSDTPPFPRWHLSRGPPPVLSSISFSLPHTCTPWTLPLYHLVRVPRSNRNKPRLRGDCPRGGFPRCQ